ncbi:MAG: MFS transporter [Patescibacteria group bacterium]
MLTSKTIRLYLTLTFVRQLGHAFISATYVTFLMSHNLSLFEVNMVNFVFFTAMFLSEIPTGALADVYGRKASFLVACFLMGLGMTLYGISESFWWFIAAEALVGIGMTFESGAFRAWAVDQMNHHSESLTLSKLFGAAEQAKYASLIIGGVVGGFVAQATNLAVPWFMSAGVYAITGTLAFFWMREDYRGTHSDKADEKPTFVETIRSSVQFIRSSKAFRFIALISVVQFIAVQAPNMFWQPFFKNALPGQSTLGILFAGMMGALIIGSWGAHRLLKRFDGAYRHILLLAQGIIGAGLIGTAMIINPLFAVPFFLLHEFARGAFNPIADAHLHEEIPSRQRATLDSFMALTRSAGAMIGLAATGLLADHTSIATTWFVSGALLVMSAAALWRNGARR